MAKVGILLWDGGRVQITAKTSLNLNKVTSVALLLYPGENEAIKEPHRIFSETEAQLDSVL